MTKYSDTEVLYVNLSDEAEALRLRTEANDARIETLQKRLSEATIQGTVVTDEGKILTQFPPTDVFCDLFEFHIEKLFTL